MRLLDMCRHSGVSAGGLTRRLVAASGNCLPARPENGEAITNFISCAFATVPAAFVSWPVVNKVTDILYVGFAPAASHTHTHTHRPKNSIFLSRGGCKEKVPRCSVWYHGRSARSRVGATRSGSVQTRRSAQATGRHLTSHMTCSVLIATLCLVFLVPYFEYFPGSLR